MLRLPKSTEMSKQLPKKAVYAKFQMNTAAKEKIDADISRIATLFCLNYSATHAKHHNLVYVLDALDAYNKKLVKKIEVKGFEVKNLRGTDSYLYLEQIVLSSKNPPKAKIELEIGYNKSINRETHIFDVGDDLSEMNIIVIWGKYGISNLQRRTKEIHRRERCDRGSYT